MLSKLFTDHSFFMNITSEGGSNLIFNAFDLPFQYYQIVYWYKVLEVLLYLYDTIQFHQTVIQSELQWHLLSLLTRTGPRQHTTYFDEQISLQVTTEQ